MQGTVGPEVARGRLLSPVIILSCLNVSSRLNSQGLAPRKAFCDSVKLEGNSLEVGGLRPAARLASPTPASPASGAKSSALVLCVTHVSQPPASKLGPTSAD